MRKDSEFFKFHNNGVPVLHEDPQAFKDALKAFLAATMDEVRVRKADTFAKIVLKLTDLDDLDHFRKGVLRKEAAADVGYEKQRDHSAHTVNNYLLGWYFIEHSATLRQAFGAALKSRGINDKDRSPFEEFGCVWPFVSLLHDIGYIFEGNLDALNTGAQSGQTHRGTQVANDYFSNHFWNACEIESEFDRHEIDAATRVAPPNLSDKSLLSLLRSLLNLGPAGSFVKAAIDSFKTPSNQPIPKTTAAYAESPAAPIDGFDLWISHYESLDGNESMVTRLKAVRHAFIKMAHTGIGDGGIRILDHAVCSGLILLQTSTLFYRLMHSIQPSNDASEKDLSKPAVKRFIKRASKWHYNIGWWWQGILWATAAAAIHNIQQLRDDKGNGLIQPLDLSEDPLAFLGVLVDIIQEWDRYRVHRHGFVAGGMPAQGSEVRLSTAEGKVEIVFDTIVRAESVRKDLDRSLKGWKTVVTVLPVQPKRE